MTADDPTLPVRQAIVPLLRADVTLIGLGSPALTAARIYGEKSPAQLTWPFVRYGQTDFGQTDGRVPIHVFSKADHTDEAATIMRRIVALLGGKTITLGDGRKLRLTYPDSGGSQIIPDRDEAGAWHGIVRLDALIVRPCPA